MNINLIFTRINNRINEFCRLGITDHRISFFVSFAWKMSILYENTKIKYVYKDIDIVLNKFTLYKK